MIQSAFTDIPPDANPFALFARWYAEAEAAEINDPDAVALATVDVEGMPDVRMVLLRGRGPDGFIFFTNGQSAKGAELEANPKAALCLHWKSLRRQIRIRGPVTPVTDAESDAYFASRARGSRIAAIASHQSRPMTDRSELEARVAQIAAACEGREPERPPHWRGYRVSPLAIEFWRDGPFRLHDRAVFSRPSPADAWSFTRLQP